jgi:dGTPase
MSISQMIQDILDNSQKMIKKFNINSIEDIRNHKFFLISMSQKLMKDCSEIREFLYDNVYNHSKLLNKRSNAENIVFKIFDYYKKNFEKLPDDWLLKRDYEIKQRIICDYISGMTDRYASKLYKSIYE